MSHRTTFAGLAAPDPGESISVLDGDFIYRNPDLTDQLLRVGAISHRHDDHVPIINPQQPLTLATIASGGTLPSHTDYFLTYTVLDQYGGETACAPPEGITTGGGLSAPTAAPSGAADYSGGIMPAGNYAYALTFTDGQGGETALGPVAWVTIDPGHASAQVDFVSLSNGLLGSGGVAAAWRLWRSYEGSDWHLVKQNSTDTFTDAGFDPPDNPARPPSSTDIQAGINSLIVTLPAASAEPAFASAASICVYLSTSPSMLSPCFYAQLPAASAGATLVITQDGVTYGQPPPVSRSLPGAGRINPETDILNFHWRTPVATWSALASGGYGDVRMTLDTGTLWGVLGASGTAGASGWTNLLAFNDPDVPPVGSAAGGSGQINTMLAFRASGEAQVSFQTLGGGSGLVTIYAPSAVSSFLASASGGTGFSIVTKALEFQGSGAASCSVTDLGNGSALVTVTVPTVAGPTGPTGPTGPAGSTGPSGPAGSAANFVASAGSASATVGPFLGFAGTGGATAQLVQTNGSAVILITAGGSTGGGGGSIVTAASAGASAVSPTSYLEFDASGGIGVAVSNQTGGSATVTFGAPPTKLQVGARNGLSYSIYGNTNVGKMALMGVNPDGTPTLLAGNAQNGGGSSPQNQGLAVSPDGLTVYEVDGGGSITVFSRHSDGTLTNIQSISGLTSPTAVAVSPDGTDVYVVQQGVAKNVQRFRRNQIDGTLTQLETYSCSGTPNLMCITPDGTGLYVTAFTGGFVTQFRRNADGSLISLGALSLSSAWGIAASPDSKNVYVVLTGLPATVQMYKRNADSSLTSLGNFSTGTANNSQSIVVSPDGLHVYIDSNNASKIEQYVRAANGTLSSNPTAGTVANAGGSNHLAISPDGQFVYGPNANVNGLQCYRRNATNGTLQFLGNYATSQFIGAGSCPIVVSPIAQSVMAANDLELIGSGGITVTMGSGSTGSAAVVISTTLPTVAGSAGITPVQPDYYTEYAASGGISVVIQSMGSGSARVLFGPGDVGTATLVAGTVTVNDPRVTSTCMIFLTPQDNNTTGALRVSARTAGTSFTITSSSGTDTGLVAYHILGA